MFTRNHFGRGAREETVDHSNSLRVAEVVSALSQALDLGSGSTQWHSVRTCILGMRIAGEMGVPDEAQANLFYSLLLKEAGCSSNASLVYRELESDDIAAKRDVKATDWRKLNLDTFSYAWTHVATGQPLGRRLRALFRIAVNQKQHTRHLTQIRCERGASMARLMGLPEQTAEGISGLDEHWDGQGNPDGLRGEEIPLASRIMLLAQTLDVLFTSEGPQKAVEVIQERSRRWFDPFIVQAARSLAKRMRLWEHLDSNDAMSVALDLERGCRTLSEGDISLDAICQAFAQIVDGKSPFTFNHSNGVAHAAVAIASRLGLPKSRILFVRHAALLHDLGKMAVSNAILEKNGKPDEAEWQILRTHPAHTQRILRSISGFEEMSEVAASHHEKLNGQGYHRGLRADELSLEARILVVSDIFDALAAKRPYRDAMPLDKVMEIIRKDVPHALDGSCVEALQQSGIECDQSFVDLYTLRTRIAEYDGGSRGNSEPEQSVLEEEETPELAIQIAKVF